MSVGRICTRVVDLADPDEPVQAAASRMRSRGVGTLLVIDDEKRPIGIVTDRDLAIRVVGDGLDPTATQVSAIMSPAPDVVNETVSIESALAQMRRGSHRRLAVVDDQGALVGLVSLDDILDLLSEEFEEIGRLVRNARTRPPAAYVSASNP